MKSIHIGKSADSKSVFITPELRRSSHMHVIGGTRTGKSKFLEWMIRRDVDEGHGLCLIDWHGTLYQDVLKYCAQLRVGLGHDFRKLVVLDPSKPEFISGFNPFMNQGEDVATQVANRIAATIRPWGITDTNQMPTFERVCRLLYTFAVEQKQTLSNAAQLLQFDKPELRDYAVEVVSDPYIKDQWRQLAAIMKSPRDWKDFVLSTENRLSRFLASKTIKRFFGLTTNNIDLKEIMDSQTILLVNLGSSGYLDRDSARVFASLLLNEFFETSMKRANEAKERNETPSTFMLYLDEFQEYITEDVAAMLDQVLKGGLHLVLAHQHLGHLLENARLKKSIFTNARIRAVFGGLDFADASELAKEMFLPDLNARQIKKAYYHTIHLYEEQTRMIRSRSSGHGTSTSSSWSTGSGSADATIAGGSTSSSISTPTVPESLGGTQNTEGWFTQGDSYSNLSSHSASSFSSEGGSTGESRFESESETEVPVWIPIPVQELGSEAEWGLEEKVSKVAETLKCQQQRHCFIKLDSEITQPLLVPEVRDYFFSRESLQEYAEEVYVTQGALPAARVDSLLADSEQHFLTEAKQVLSTSGPIEVQATNSSKTTSTSGKSNKRASRSARDSLFAKIKEPS
jgi:hypothetical protein